MQGHADRNASLVIGQRLIARYKKPFQEKPQAPLCAERVVKATGVSSSQVAKRKEKPSLSQARHEEGNEHGTAQDGSLWMEERPSSIPHPLRLFK